MFTLVDRLIIKNPSINTLYEETKGCFLYKFKEGGFSIELFERWLNGKIMDIYEYDGGFGAIRTCPWCKEKAIFEKHLVEHHKGIKDAYTIKLSQKAYPLLLSYLRKGSYDALLFLVHRSCQFCIDPVVEGREGKCSLAESSRNKPRSLNLLGLQFDGFKIKKYSHEAVAIVYRRNTAF